MAPFNSALEIWGIPLGIGVAALTGSLHCTVMCGPIVSSIAPRPRQWLSYQSGRMLSYISLGAIAGGLSSQVQNLLAQVKPLEQGYAVVLALLLIYWGVQQWHGKNFKIPGITWLGAKGRRALSPNPFTMGFFSALLPCGYLHGFLIGAFATRSATKGALVMTAFALGSAPGLFGAPLLARFMSKVVGQAPSIRAHFHRISAVLIVLSGLWSGLLFSGILGGSHGNHESQSVHANQIDHSQHHSH